MAINNFDNADSSFQGLGGLLSTYVLGNTPGCTDPTQSNYNSNATVDDGSCIPFTAGCTNPLAANYNASVTIDDGSCLFAGCMNPLYLEFDAIYQVDTSPSSCLTLISYGCTDDSTATIGDGSGFAYLNHTNGATILGQLPCDGSQVGTADDCVDNAYGVLQFGANCCCVDAIVGCTDAAANNYNASANTSPAIGSNLECTYSTYGCMDPAANNYDVTATSDDGTCEYVGCNDPLATNLTTFVNPINGVTYNATIDDGSCIYSILGCTDPTSSNYDANATIDDGSCAWNGCSYLDAGYTGFASQYATATAGYYVTTSGFPYALQDLWANSTTPAIDANGNVLVQNINYFDDGSCAFSGCTDSAAINYNPPLSNSAWPGAGITDDGSCYYTLGGCTDVTACNYDSAATFDDGSCILPDGCTDATAFNYDALAVCDDGSCISAVLGCTDAIATNFNSGANTDDGSCIYLSASLSCTDNNGLTRHVGDAYGGGVIFHFSIEGQNNGDCGMLITANFDICRYEWKWVQYEYILNTPGIGTNYGQYVNSADVATNSIGAGYQNTKDMIQYSGQPIPGTSLLTPSTAANGLASQADSENFDLNGEPPQGDWFIGSKQEIAKFVENLGPSSPFNNPVNLPPPTLQMAPYNTCWGPIKQALWSSTEIIETGLANPYNGCPNPVNGTDVGCQGHGIVWVLEPSPIGTNFPYTEYTLYQQGQTEYRHVRPFRREGTLGCIDSSNSNYNPLASWNDGSCAPPPVVGDTHQGGIVFYVSYDGVNGLIAAPTDQATSLLGWGGAPWGCYGTDLPGANDSQDGAQNTDDISAGCTDVLNGNVSTSNIAANLCVNLTLGGYTDWFLPSSQQLNYMYANIGPGSGLFPNLGAFTSGEYWSSREIDANNAYSKDLGSGSYSSITNKNDHINVRAIRAYSYP